MAGMEEEWEALVHNQAWNLCKEAWQEQLKAMEAQVWTLGTWEEYIELRGRRMGLISAFRVVEALRFDEGKEPVQHY